MHTKFASWKRGFTMIELLVVIAIIGVLAAAVLSAINPVEQINKGRDTAIRSDAAELVNATERYFAVQEKFPWNTAKNSWNPSSSGNDNPGVDPDNLFSVDGTADSKWLWVKILEDTSEVKANFYSRILKNRSKMLAVKEADSGTVFVCFEPSSNQFKEEATERCAASNNGLPTTGSVTGSICAAGSEYICVP